MKKIWKCVTTTYNQFKDIINSMRNEFRKNYGIWRKGNFICHCIELIVAIYIAFRWPLVAVGFAASIFMVDNQEQLAVLTMALAFAFFELLAIVALEFVIPFTVIGLAFFTHHWVKMYNVQP